MGSGPEVSVAPRPLSGPTRPTGTPRAHFTTCEHGVARSPRGEARLCVHTAFHVGAPHPQSHGWPQLGVRPILSSSFAAGARRLEVLPRRITSVPQKGPARRNPGPRFVGRAPAAGRLLGAQGARGVQAPVSFPPAPRLSQNAASQGTRVPSSLPRFSEKMTFPGSISFPSPSWRCCGSPGQPRPESGLGHLQIWWELWGQLAAPDRGLETLIG